MEIIVVLIGGFLLGIPIIAVISLIRSGNTRKLVDQLSWDYRDKLADLTGEIANLRRELGEVSQRASRMDAVSSPAPHAAAEEASLYPAIDRLVGAGTTQTMTLDHQAIADVIAQLGVAANGDIQPGARVEAQRLLFVLEALLTTHLWKEDTAYVPLLARLDFHAYTALHAEVAEHMAHREHTH